MAQLKSGLKGKRALALVFAMVIVSPVFGVILADVVGYHEPLDLAAEALGLKDLTEEVNWTPFLDYTVPGLPPELGYVASGFIGVAIVLGLGYLLAKLLR